MSRLERLGWLCASSMVLLCLFDVLSLAVGVAQGVATSGDLSVAMLSALVVITGVVFALRGAR